MAGIPLAVAPPASGSATLSSILTDFTESTPLRLLHARSACSPAPQSACETDYCIALAKANVLQCALPPANVPDPLEFVPCCSKNSLAETCGSL
jgi:hypothetical protein